MITDYRKLQEVIDADLEIDRISDIDLLLEKILEVARKLVNADAGSIYVVDDENAHRLHFRYTQNDTLHMEKTLALGQVSLPITHDSIAGFVACTGKILNIEDVYRISSDLPYSFNDDFDRESDYLTKSMLVFPLKLPPLFQDKEKDDVIGVLQLINAQDKKGKVITFSEDSIKLIQLFAHKAGNAIHQAQMMRSMILGMIRVAEMRDPKETGQHVKRVGAISAEVYETWALKRGYSTSKITKFKDALRMTAMLHDVGKVAIEDAILKKPGKLTAAEFERMKQHTVLGARLLLTETRSNYDVLAASIALNHHERWDGTGYPGHVDPLTGGAEEGFELVDGKASGKKGEEIPIEARIVAVVDVYDALSHRRVYKGSWREEDVINEMRKGNGSSFDPDVLAAFFECYEKIKAINDRLSNQE